MAPSSKRGKANEEKLSKLCAKSWWKLKMSDRTSHNEAMKIQLLSPFLYRNLYQSRIWLEWAKTAGMLTDNRLMELNELSVEELMYTELVELAIFYLQERIQNDFSSKSNQNSTTLEGVIDQLDKYQKESRLAIVISKIRNESWFQSIKSRLIDCPIIDRKMEGKFDAAILLVAWQVSYYMKAIYKGSEMLKEYEEQRIFDEESDNNKKKGNQYFKDGNYEQAIITYTNILCNKPYLHIVYGNRAICYIKKQKFRCALADGRRCVTLDPKYSKGQLRYAEALFELGFSKAALQVLEKAQDICDSKDLIVDYMNKIKDKIENDNKVYNNISPTSQLSCDTDYDESDDGSDGNDSEDDDLPPLVTDSDDNDDDEDVAEPGHKRKKMTDTNATSAGSKKPLPAYVVGSFYKNESSDTLAKKRAEERDNKKQDSLMEKFKSRTKKASGALLKPANFQGVDPIEEYDTAKQMLSIEPSLISTKERVLLSYAHAVSHLKGKTTKQVMKSIDMFEEITTKFKNVVFPLPYLGIGRARMRIKQYFMANDPFDRALLIDTKPGCLTNCVWPGTDIEIEETLPGKLKSVIEDLMKIVKSPPGPDATCFYQNCIKKTDKIYFDELEFGGFLRIQCDKKHVMEFHAECWLKVRLGRPNNTYKGVCFTPQCRGTVMMVENYKSSNGKPDIEYKHERASQIDLLSYIQPTASPKTKKKKKKNNNTNTNSTNDILNGKNEEDKENSQPSSKSKKKKKKNSNNSPETIRKNTHFAKYRESIIDNFNFSKYDKTIENAQSHVFQIYYYVETMLLSKRDEPYIHIKSNLQLLDYLENLNDKVKTMLNDIGGFRELITKCSVFSFDERQRNILFLTEKERDYINFKKSMEQSSNIPAPECDEPLFTSNGVIKDLKNSNAINDSLTNGHVHSKMKGTRAKIVEIESDEDDDSPQTVQINVGIQVDTRDNTEKEKNEKTIKDLQQSLDEERRSFRGELERLLFDNKEVKESLAKLQTKSQNEIDEYKKQIEQLKREKEEFDKAYKAQGNENNKLKQENSRIKETAQKHLKKLEAKDRESKSATDKADSLANELKQTRTKYEQDKLEHEDIVNGLTNSLNEESKRAERVEVALLESKRDLVVIKYQQQANVIQNTINQMQFLPHLPDMVRLRKIWEDYKIEYQHSYEKMHEEFSNFIQSVRQGQRLDTLPPAQYSHPPPYPQSPMPPGRHGQAAANPPIGPTSSQFMLNQHRLPRPPIPPSAMPPHQGMHLPMQPPIGTLPPQQQQPQGAVGLLLCPNPQAQSTAEAASMPHPTLASIVDSTRSRSDSIPSEQKYPTAQPANNQPDDDELQAMAAYTTQAPHSDSEDSEASSRGDKEDNKYNKFFEKVIMKLGSKFPTYQRDELLQYFNDYRRQGPLSGQKIDDIVLNIERMIRRNRREEAGPRGRDNGNQQGGEKKKNQRVQGSGALNHGATPKRQRANQVKQGLAGANAHNVHNIFGMEEPCVICYEDMQANNALLLHCGHTFHRECIHCWLKEQRTCPVCRVLALLPDEYPALG